MTLFAGTNNIITSYVYNSDGIRTQKVHYDENAEYVGTTKYTLDGNKIVAENRLGTNIYYTYDDKGSIMGMVYGGYSYVFSKNLQGDVIGIYNENRQLVAKYEYSAFGEITAITDANGNDVSANSNHIANINPFRYKGYYYDTETGFYYLITRYYDPQVGRFINSDIHISTGQGILGNNMFAYCLNDPINSIDSLGAFSLKWKLLREKLWIGYIHRQVQLDISKKYGYLREVALKNGKRVDVLDSETGMFWEVKHNSKTCGISLGLMSLLKYNGKEYDGKTLMLGSLTISGEFFCGAEYFSGEYAFKVSYRTVAPGIILYDFDIVEYEKPLTQREPVEEAVKNPTANYSFNFNLTPDIGTNIFGVVVVLATSAIALIFGTASAAAAAAGFAMAA